MKRDLEQLCRSFLQGELAEPAFLQQCLKSASSTLSLAEVDLDRKKRCGFPEVIYSEGKPVSVIVEIINTLLSSGEPVLATRLAEDQAKIVQAEFPNGHYRPDARTFRIGVESEPRFGKVPVITAGTSDHGVAWEAVETLSWMNVESLPLFDLGVAGPHRLPAHLHHLTGADAVIVVAGMEGALPSVVAGYLDCPVVAVPTSQGYGANLQGVAALLAMLNSCAANVAVVNIDAGFKAGYVAGLMAHQRRRAAQAAADRQ